MKLKLLFTTLIACCVFGIAHTQNTVGLLSYDYGKTFDGYNLHFPHNQGTAYLLNNCGQIVHKWEDDSGYRPGNGVYLTENGYLYVCKGRGAASNSDIHAGGGGEKIEVRDWDNNIVWEYTLNDSLFRLHHDITVTPDGNVLAIAWERKTAEEAIQAGRDPAKLDDGELWPDFIIELKPDGNGGANVVWEWHVWDHLIQDFDETKDNYGNPADHPELVDINHYAGVADWMHSNSIDYDQFNKHVMLCVPTFNEIWIIERTMDSDLAAGHVGGTANSGGDLLFRWGNPATYRAGDSTDQKLFYPHDAHWADIELGFGGDFNKIAIFNNRAGADYSSVHLIDAYFDPYSYQYGKDDGIWLPNEFEWTYKRPIPQEMYSTGLSSVQRFRNGNTLIAVGRFGYTFEITPDEEIVWEYKNPMLTGQPVAQGSELAINNNLQFRMHRYSTSYSAFDGRDLDTPLGYIELEPNEDFCSMLINTEEVSIIDEVNIFPNPTSNEVQIDITGDIEAQELEIFDALGKRIYQVDLDFNKNHIIRTSDWSKGVYFVYLDSRAAGKFVVIK